MAIRGEARHYFFQKIALKPKICNKIYAFMAVFRVWQQLYAKMDLTALAIVILTALCALVMPLQGFYIGWGNVQKSPLEPQKFSVVL